MAEIVVSVADYRALTCDDTTDETTVSARIDDAIELIGEDLDRWIPLDTYTEEVRVVDGHACPRGVPVLAISSPSANAVIEMAGYVISLWGEEGFDIVVGEVVNSSHIFTPITYQGGYTAATLPPSLRRAIVELAWRLAHWHPATLGVTGATSMSVGDVSVSFKSSSGTSPLDVYMPGLSSRIRRYRRRLGEVSA